MRTALKALIKALALVTTLAGANTAMAQSSGSTSVVSRAPKQQTKPPVRKSEAEMYAAAQRNAAHHRTVFDPANPDNFTPGKSYRDLTAADFQRLHREMHVVITAILLDYSNEYYDVIDSIRPTAMTRDQFLHVLLREAARRGILNQFLNISGFVPPELADKNVTISRPLDVPAEQRATATMPALDAVYRDIATRMLQEPRIVDIPMTRDIANQIGFTNGGGSIEIDNDIGALITGYTAGSNPLFFNGNQAGYPAGSMPLTVGFNSAVTVPQLREAYCAIVPAITAPGRPYGVYQNMAASAGFLMAREDARNGFASNDLRLAYKDVLCPTSPKPWNPTAMGIAISGIDLLPEQAGNKR